VAVPNKAILCVSVRVEFQLFQFSLMLRREIFRMEFHSYPVHAWVCDSSSTEQHLSDLYASSEAP
jgi:hypothetical protein